MSKRSADSRKESAHDPTDESGEHVNVPSLFESAIFRAPESGTTQAAGGQAVLVVSADATIAEVIQAPESFAGETLSTLVGTDIDTIWAGDPAGRLATHVKRAVRSRQVQSAEYWTESDDSYHDFIFIPHGRDRVMVVARDVSERKTEFSRIERLAYLDDITTLPNRQFLFEELERCTDLLKLQEGRAAVICFDIKSGDGEGGSSSKRHNVIFRELASRLTHELRGANSLDIDDYERYSVAARIEYSQFGVILPVIENGADAEGVTRRLLDTLQQPIKLENGDAKVSARAGIALFPQDGTDTDTLYSNAVAAMEDARNNDSTPYKFHSGTVRLRALQRQDLQLELRAALDRDEFTVEFLPTVDAESREVRAFEALLRWPENVFGPQSIQKVISIAENTGLILPIGDWVLRQACECLKGWHDAGWPDLRVSVNLSVQEFSREDLAERIASILQESAIEPHFLDIEITEYSLFRDAMKNYVMCSSLKNLGIGIVIDDYGTGACSLAHVARSPVDGIKIDNSFVTNATHESVDRAACAAIAAMAARLGKRIIAEGVETEEQATMLKEQGCDELQGFVICKPTSAEGVLSFLSSDTNDE